MRTLEREVKSGLRRLSGGRIAGNVYIDETIVNDGLQTHGSAGRDARIEFQDANAIVVHYRLLRFRALLAEQIDLEGSPRIRVRLASILLAWTLERTLTLPYVQVHGRWITFDLGALTSMKEYHALWEHVQSVRLSTSPGKLTVHFSVQIA